MNAENATPLSSADAPNTLRGAAADFSRHRSPRILAAIAVICAVVRLALWQRGLTPGIADLSILLIVVLGWPLMEWSAHRYLLHLRPVTLP